MAAPSRRAMDDLPRKGQGDQRRSKANLIKENEACIVGAKVGAHAVKYFPATGTHWYDEDGGMDERKD